jgi:hypothetical protein
MSLKSEAIKKFLNAARSLANQGLSKDAIMQFAKNEFGEITELFQRQIDNIFKPKKGIENIKIKDPDFDDTVVEMQFDEFGPFNPKDPLKNLKKQTKPIRYRGPDEFDTRKQYEEYLDSVLGPADEVFGNPLKDDLLREFDKVKIENVTPKKTEGIENISIEERMDRIKGTSKKLDEAIKEYEEIYKPKKTDDFNLSEDDPLGDLEKIIKGEGDTGLPKKSKKMTNVEEAIDNASPGFAGDIKYDAQLVADDLAERMGKTFDDLSQKEQIDLYDQAYKGLSKQRFKNRPASEDRALEDFVDDAGGVNPDDPRGIDDFIPDPEDMAQGGIAGYYTGGMVDVEPNLSDIGHGSDSLMARTRLISPNNQATTSTGLNYLLAEDNDNLRVPFSKGKLADIARRKFMKAAGAGAAGLAALKTGLLGFGKEAAPVVEKVAETVSETAQSVPPYFFRLVEKIKFMGDDTLASQDKAIAKKYKDYIMEEDFAGNITIIKKSTDDMYPEDVYMSYKVDDVSLPNKDGFARVDEYEEFTARPDMEGKMKDVEPGVPDEVIEEAGDTTALTLKKADGGIARMLGE